MNKLEMKSKFQKGDLVYDSDSSRTGTVQKVWFKTIVSAPNIFYTISYTVAPSKPYLPKFRASEEHMSEWDGIPF